MMRAVLALARSERLFAVCAAPVMRLSFPCAAVPLVVIYKGVDNAKESKLSKDAASDGIELPNLLTVGQVREALR